MESDSGPCPWTRIDPVSARSPRLARRYPLAVSSASSSVITAALIPRPVAVHMMVAILVCPSIKRSRACRSLPSIPSGESGSQLSPGAIRVEAGRPGAEEQRSVDPIRDPRIVWCSVCSFTDSDSDLSSPDCENRSYPQAFEALTLHFGVDRNFSVYLSSWPSSAGLSDFGLSVFVLSMASSAARSLASRASS